MAESLASRLFLKVSDSTAIATNLFWMEVSTPTATADGHGSFAQRLTDTPKTDPMTLGSPAAHIILAPLFQTGLLEAALFPKALIKRNAELNMASFSKTLTIIASLPYFLLRNNPNIVPGGREKRDCC